MAMKPYKRLYYISRYVFLLEVLDSTDGVKHLIALLSF